MLHRGSYRRARFRRRLFSPGILAATTGEKVSGGRVVQATIVFRHLLPKGSNNQIYSFYGTVSFPLTGF